MNRDRGAVGSTIVALVAWGLLACPPSGRAATNPTLLAIPNNTALDLGRLVLEQPAGSSYPADGVTDYSGFTYDPLGHQMLMFGGGHATTHTDTVYSFNFTTLSWVSLYHPVPRSFYTAANFNATYCAWQNRTDPPMTPLARHTYDTLVVPGQRGKLLMFRRDSAVNMELSAEILGGTAWPSSAYLPEFNTATNTWRWINAGPNTPPTGFGSITCEYDPVSDTVICIRPDDLSPYGLWIYDPKTETASHPLTFTNLGSGIANDLVYYPPNQKMYYMVHGSPGRVFELTLNRTNWPASTFVEVTGMIGTPSWGETGWGYDSVSQVIGGAVQNGQFRAYNPLSKVWTTRTMNVNSPGGNSVGTQTFHCMSFDPVDGVFIFITDGSGGRRTWAYRYLAYNDSTPPAVPQNVQAAAVSESQINLSWSPSSDPESGIGYYNVYRDGVLAASNLTQTSYADTGLAEATSYTYQVTAVNGALLESDRSDPAGATTLADTIPPTITSVSASGAATQVKLIFSKPVDPASAQAAANYVINTPTTINVLAASLAADGKTVTLTTAPMSNGVTYTLRVSNVTDRARTPNVIAPGTQVPFTYIALVLLVDFGPSAGTDTYGLAGWQTTVHDVYTLNYGAGPGGMAVSIGGSDGQYNFQGVTSATPRTFVEGEKIVVTWYNNHATSTYTFTPRVSLDFADRPTRGGTWHPMTPLTLAPGQTGTTQYVFDATGAGNYSVVNVNASYTFATANSMVCDKIELLGATRRVGDVNGDGHVDVVDLLFLVDAFGAVTGDVNYDARCDFNSDGGVDVIDLLMMVDTFGT